MPLLYEAHNYIFQKNYLVYKFSNFYKLFFVFTLKYITPLSNQLNKKRKLKCNGKLQ